MERFRWDVKRTASAVPNVLCGQTRRQLYQNQLHRNSFAAALVGVSAAI
jgi:hypothetical protein